MNEDKRTKLIKAISDCRTISELFELVKKENIDIRMQTLCSASSIPPRPIIYEPKNITPPLTKLKDAVTLAVEISK